MAAKKFKKKHNSFADDIKDFFSSYRKYISAGALLALLACVIAGYSHATETNKSTTPSVQTEEAEQNSLQQQEFELDAYEGVTSLVEDYYKYYAKGDVDSLEKIAYPISDTEKSYIKMFSKYVDKYDHIKCYTKKGISDGEFVASVMLDMKFKGVKAWAPGLDFFYIRTDEDGDYYIDNAYGEFNQSNQENTTDSEINALVDEFEQDEDVIALQKEVQTAYNDALDSNDDLKKMVKGTVQDAITDWVASFSTQTAKADEESKEQSESEEQDTKSEETDAENEDTKSDDTKNEEDTKENDTKDDSTKTEEKIRTIYAKTDVNLRKKSSTDSKILTTLKKGAKLKMYGNSKDGWCKVSYKDMTGYVMKKYVVFDKAELTKAEEKTRTMYAKTDVNLRKKSSTSSKVIRTVKKGAKLTMYGNSKDGWCKVKYKGDTGYVMRKYIVTSKSKIKSSSKTDESQDKVIFIPEGKKIELSQTVNVRAAMSAESELVGVAYKGEVVTVVMSYDDGWTKVLWNDITGYIKSEYLQ